MKYSLVSTYFFLIGCTEIREATCEETADAYRPEAIKMIVTSPSKSVYDFKLNGVSFDSKPISFSSENYTWALDFNSLIEVGDTVIKNSGGLEFYIHKKDSVLVFPFECQGKIFK